MTFSQVWGYPDAAVMGQEQCLHSPSCCYLQMTDVEAGGATVFPEIGLSLVPKKVDVIVSLMFGLSVS